MTKKIVPIIFVAIFFGAVLSGATVIQAAAKELEIEYPEFTNIPLLQTPNTIKTLLPDYIKYVIVFGIVFSGLIIFGSLLFAGFLYMTSSGNPAALKNSKDRMLSSFLGIIILLSSYLILNTINPNLIELKIDPRASTTTKGVVFIDIDNKEYETMTNVPDFNATGVPDPISVKFLPLSSDVEVVPCLVINDFKESNCEDLYSTITSSASWDPTAKAAKLIWKTPGVYLYDKTNYGGELRIYNTGQGTLSQFNDKAESINFFHSLTTNFGAVLHDNEGFEGECKFIMGRGALTDLGSDWNNKAGSLTVFKNKSGMPYEGGGVKFYKEPNYQDDSGGYFTIHNTGWTPFDFNDTNDNIYSIKIDGDYLVAIAEEVDGGGSCEVFIGSGDSDSDLSDNPIGQCYLWGGCAPGCWGIPGVFCPTCTGSCASSFKVIPLSW